MPVSVSTCVAPHASTRVAAVEEADEPFSSAQLLKYLKLSPPCLARWLCVGASYAPFFAKDVQLVHGADRLATSTTAELLSEWLGDESELMCVASNASLVTGA